MDKETLGQYGWVVICVIVLAIMITFATPFGNKIASEVVETVTTMTSTANTALDEISVGGYDGGVGGGAGGGAGVELINFSINVYSDVYLSFQAEDGMTWGDFINSEYNPSHECSSCGETHSTFINDAGNVFYGIDECCFPPNPMLISADDVIADNGVYTP